ncbi:MAG: class I SAM-dependent methyltransferase [Candidatus Nanopelagicales bacterium]
MSERDRTAIRDFYNELGSGEWERLDRDVAGRVSFEVHRRFLDRFIAPGMSVLEVGAGPGRFTFELARLGARVLVTDYSPTQLELNRQTVSPTGAEAAVVGRELLDVCDTSRFGDGEFDAVVAYGGPLSYAFDEIEEAMRGLLRITRPGGIALASVMGMLGAWRYLLPSINEFAVEYGEDVNDAILASGDTRIRGNGHLCKMFRSSEIVDLVETCGGQLLSASASNWASMNPPEFLAELEADPDRWARFLEHEVAACAERGAWDGGTHLLFAMTHG